MKGRLYMSYQLIKEGVDKIKEINFWSAFLVKYDHKKHPDEYECFNLNFSTSELLYNTVVNMSNSYIAIVNKYDNNVLEYTGMNPKNVVDKISVDNVVMSNSWKSLLNHINCSDDETPLRQIKANAYVFKGTYTLDDLEKNIYLITCKNPIKTYNNKKGVVPTFLSRNNTVIEADEPLIHFNRSFDAIVYRNILYMINTNCERVFNMEYSHKIITNKCLSKLIEKNIIENFDTYKKYVMSGQTSKNFLTYNESIVEKLNQTEYKTILSEKLHIPYNKQTGQFDLSDSNHAKIFTKAICDKTKYNMFDNGICEVPISIPISFD